MTSTTWYSWAQDAPPPPAENNSYNLAPNKGINRININDLPPEIAGRANAERQERRSKGYRTTTDAEIDRYTLSNMRKAFVPNDKINKKLSQKISKAVTNSVYGDMILEGVIPATHISRDVVYGISRIYTLHDASFLMVKEVDLDSGIKIAIAAEALNENVNGSPAALSISKSQTGKMMASLTWVANTKLFTITKRGKVAGSKQIRKLIKFAQSLK